MGDHRIGSKSFNPYDLGAVGEVMREYRSAGRMGALRSEPYTPPQKREGAAQDSQGTGKLPQRKS